MALVHFYSLDPGKFVSAQTALVHFCSLDPCKFVSVQTALVQFLQFGSVQICKNGTGQGVYSVYKMTIQGETVSDPKLYKVLEQIQSFHV